MITLKEALTLARRHEEKKIILGTLPQFSCKDALKLAESLLQEEGVKAEARLAVDQIKEKLEKQRS